MKFYPTLPAGTSPVPAHGDGGMPAGMVAVRPADLIRPSLGGASALVARPAAAGPVVPVLPGEPLVFCHQVTVAPAVVRRSGEVRAGGWLPDHVTLGVLEAHLPAGEIGELIEDFGCAEQRRRLSCCGAAARSLRRTLGCVCSSWRGRGIDCCRRGHHRRPRVCRCARW